MDAVRFGVVGLGEGRARARRVQQTPGAVLAGICDSDAERLRTASAELGCRGFADYDAMLADDSIEVIYLVTPSGTHLEVGARAAAAGKHVIVIKPMETTVERCQRLIEACHAHGVHLVVDFEWRYTPPLQQWKAALKAGEFGDVLFAEARCKVWRDQAYYDQGGWRGTWALDGGGSLANQGIHAVDLLVWLCGNPQVLSARAEVVAHRIETEDLTVALLELPNGRPALLTTTTCDHLDNEFGVAIAGTLGSASNLPRGELRCKFARDGRAGLRTPAPAWPRSAAADMIAVLRQGTAPHVPGAEGLRSVHLMEAVYRAAGVR
jgi:UDP-N-acetyl-2-amino-2-deoxyglucuronate dehydrogenase